MLKLVLFGTIIVTGMIVVVMTLITTTEINIYNDLNDMTMHEWCQMEQFPYRINSY